MSGPNGNGRVWLKILSALLPLAVTGLIGYGALRNQVQSAHDKLAEKANRETVSAQNEAVLRELQAVREELRALRAEVIRRRP